jgi:hypothetical protein
MEDTEVQRQKEQNAKDKTNPMPGRDFHHLRFTIYNLRADGKSNRKSF